MTTVRLEVFIEWINRELPDQLDGSFVAKVWPNPWILRAGHGKDARIRMILGPERHRYERRPGDTIWRRMEGAAPTADLWEDAA